MLAKLRLDRTSTYEITFAAKQVSQMLVDFVEGKSHILSIGVEQGIPKWDDFIIEREAGSYQHVQVKRQITDFSTDPCTRNNITQGTNAGKPKKLSPLDESIAAIATWLENRGDDQRKRQFLVICPDYNTVIKDSFTVGHLYSVCNDHVSSTTNIEGLQQLEKDDQTVYRCFEWLRTWCNIKDYEKILESLKLLDIKAVGLENGLNGESENLLKRVFKDEKRVLREIKSYIQENSTYTGQIAARQLLNEVKDYLLPGISLWTNFEQTGKDWKISGIHDLDTDDLIERPNKIVYGLWQNKKSSILQFGFDKPGLSLVNPQPQVLQLALHLRGGNIAFCTDWSSWEPILMQSIGYTLGVTDEDVNNLNVQNNSSPSKASQARELVNISERDSEADQLEDEILRTTLLKVDEYFQSKIDSMPTNNSTELRDSLEERWSLWQNALKNDLQITKDLFKSILQPKSEGEGIRGELRIGPKTVILIAEAIYWQLIIICCLNEGEGDDCFNRTDYGHEIKTIGIRFWSGPHDKKNAIKRVEDEESLKVLLSKESNGILILSECQSNSSFANSNNMALTGSDFSIASAHRPKLVVTPGDWDIQRLINAGSISDLRAYLLSQLQKPSEAKQQAINRLMI